MSFHSRKISDRQSDWAYPNFHDPPKLRKAKQQYFEASRYNDIGRPEAAVDLLEKALTAFKEMRDEHGESAVFSEIGMAYQRLGWQRNVRKYYKIAIDKIGLALNIAKRLSDRNLEAGCYMNFAIIYDALGNHEKALAYLELARPIFADLKDELSQAGCDLNMGAICFALGHRAKAIEYQSAALPIFKRTGDAIGEATSLFNLGRYYEDQSPMEALVNFNRYFALQDWLGKHLLDFEDKAALFSQSAEAYRIAVKLISREDKKGAFELVEKGKARLIVEMFSGSQIKGSAAIPQTLLDEYEILRRQIQEFEISGMTMQSDRQLDASILPGLLSRRDAMITKIESYDEEYASLRRAKTASLEEIQGLLSANNAILLEYFLTGKEVLIFVLTGNNLAIERSPLSDEKLEELMIEYQATLENPEEKAHRLWDELSEFLIKPIEKHLHANTPMVFVPNELLHYLPLHAIPLGNGKPIICEHPIVYSASASALRFRQNAGRKHLGSMVAFYAREGGRKYLFAKEAKLMSELFGADRIPDPSRNDIRQRLDNDIIHFACHGKFNGRMPLMSGLKIGNNQTLRTRDVLKMRIQSELVTLSACETGVSDVKPGDNLVGLTYSFLYAGASSVLVSLWEVDDSSTYAIMSRFYRQLKREYQKAQPFRKARALQKAMIHVMNSKENRYWKHPYYWAPFILVGNWH